MPQLNPEFFISQLFWLFVSFTFLFIFLWRISLPRIGTVIEKRANKIKEDLKVAKQYQAEAEEIQIIIDNQLLEAKLKTSDLIKLSNQELQDFSSKELEKLDKSIETKLDEAYSKIEKDKTESINEINNQIFDITKLTLSKISNITVSENDIKEVVKDLQPKRVN